ncbi:hypothetical protein GN157_15295 [Flavobacterium rakeshii]|uniref:Lipoprotein n=1 Tax=Flavobacterium rakeshii TaxID=1038845 RepID=A0A6N8HH61_9FLAO|nr:hypothetical protein [Flavobacterium rakeshii]MUV05082.1 hypothetical protein [Flavobacterium rakeshii]
MKKTYVLAFGASVLLLASCGPKRLGCNGRKWCDTENMQKTEKTTTVKKDV